MNANQLKKLLKFHRSFGMVLGILVLFWALTGVLHPIMSATQPQPLKRMLPPQQLDLNNALPAKMVLEQNQIEQFSALQVIQVNANQTAYRVLGINQNMAEYYDVHSGHRIENAELQYAKRLAVWYTGLTEERIVFAQQVTEFSDDYPSVNRLLPIWRVDFDQGLRAYVDPSHSRLATISNDQKMWMARIFRLGHTWTWNNQQWFGQTLLMQFALIGILVITCMGIGLFFKIHNRKNHRLREKPTRFLHRYLGISLSVFILLWVVSGFYHLWQKKPEIKNIQPIFKTQDLDQTSWQLATAQSIQRLHLVPISYSREQTRTAWMIQLIGKKDLQGSMTAVKEHDHHGHSKNQTPAIQWIDAEKAKPIDVLEQSRFFVADYLNLPIEKIGQSTWVTSFGGEYGFINKRLPVVRVDTHLKNQLRLYIEPSSGVIAAKVTTQDALEGKSFTYLHKWSWLPIDKIVRDILLGLIAALIAVLVILGFCTYRKKR